VLTIATWWLLVNGLAWLVVYLLGPSLSILPDRGVGLSKTLGVLLFAIIVWTMAAVGLPISVTTVWMTVGVACTVAVVSRRARSTEGGGTSHAPVLVAETIFLGTFLAFAALRSLTPNILGGEKWMDFALLNAAMRAEAFPPVDPWFAGEPVNYYYFGYFSWGLVAKALATVPAVAYNLAVATIAAQLASAAFSLGLALTGRLALAAGGALLIVLGGSFALLAQAGFWAGRPDLFGATRIIEGAITEFPFFSLTWGDLHPHLMNAPLVVAFLALLLRLTGTGRSHLPTAVLLGVVAGAMTSTSPWDAPLLAGLCACLLLFTTRANTTLARRLVEAGTVAAAAVLVSLPFLTSFVAPPLDLALTTERSSPVAFALSAGPWLVPVCLWLGWWVVDRQLPEGAGGTRATAAFRRHGFPAGLALVALIAWAIPEIVHLDDMYGPPHERMNTVFKLHWLAVLCAAPIVPLAWQRALSADRPWRRRTGLLVLGTCLAGQAVFPAVWLATQVRAGWRQPTLDGHRYLRERAPDVYEAVTFFRTQTTGQPVIVEATGDSYGLAGRVSANTGLPTILGWRGHQGLWRGHARWAGRLHEREEAIDRIYLGPDEDSWRALRQYEVRYVVVGDVERARYPDLDQARWQRLGRLAFASGSMQVYEILDRRAP
jgi:uncharacterized membrane protein